MDKQSAQALAQEIADRLGQVDGVRAVVLGGSWARGAADPQSDLDLGIYYDAASPPSLDALQTLAAELDDSGRGDAVTDFGAWGPWINGGAWLTVGGQRVDWLYRDLARVKRVMDECIAGRPAVHYQSGHPHGFHTHIYLGEVALCQPLHDPAGELASLKQLTAPYPPQLRRALVLGSLWEAGFALETSRKSAARGDVFHVAGGLFRCVACLVQVLFALNERYWLNEKGSVEAVEQFGLCPAEFAPTVRAVLSSPGMETATLQRSLALLGEQVNAVRSLCDAADLLAEQR